MSIDAARALDGARFQLEECQRREIDRARANEAARRWNAGEADPQESQLEIAARLGREGWMPPPAIDPLEGEIDALLLQWPSVSSLYTDFALAAMRRGIEIGRELERDQLQPVRLGTFHTEPSHDMVVAGAAAWRASAAPEASDRVRDIWRAMATKAIDMVEVTLEDFDTHPRDLVGTPTLYAVWPRRR